MGLFPMGMPVRIRGRRQEILRRRKEVQAQTIRTAKTAQQGPQGAYDAYIRLLTSLLSHCPLFVDSLYSRLKKTSEVFETLVQY